MRCISLLLLILTLMTSHAETLNIATPSFSPPFVMTADNQNHFIGFSIDIMAEVCKQMKVTCQIKSMPFSDTFDAVIRNEADLAIGSYTITQDREAYVQFSIPYLPSTAAILTLTDSPMTSTSELKSKRVGTEVDSAFNRYLEKKYGNNIKIMPYANISEMMTALIEGKVDAIIFDKETADFWLGNNYAMFKILGKPFSLGSGIGIMARKDNASLMARVNQALINMQSNGSYLKIHNIYFGDTK